MKNKNLFLLVTILSALSGFSSHLIAGIAVPAHVTYQGYITERGVPAEGLYDIITSIYDAPTGGNLVGPPTTNRNVRVQKGLFSIEVKVPVGGSLLPPDDDNPWWWEHCVQHPEDPMCWVMGPRQRINPTVQSIYAQVAAGVQDGAVMPSMLAAGAVGNMALQQSAITGDKIADHHVVRSMNGLTDSIALRAGDGLTLNTFGNELVLAAAAPDCITYSNCYWNLLGNGNITAGVNFLGTIAGELDPLEMRVNNNRCMFYVFTAGGEGPNLIGGHAGNVVPVGTLGGTIGGGGAIWGPNLVNAHYGTVAGGVGNSILPWAHFSAIGGGWTNQIQGGATNATIAGGTRNLIGNFSRGATIGGGGTNTIRTHSPFCTVGGGMENLIHTNVNAATVSGGSLNRIESDGHMATISGGFANLIQSLSAAATIGGGGSNVVQNSASYSTIAGGFANGILSGAISSTIGGGNGNLIQGQTPNATIAGGNANLVQANAISSAIGGGTGNNIQNNAYFSTISGGLANSIKTDASYGAIGGGTANNIHQFARYSVIDGGTGNTISTNSPTCAVGGGSSNTIEPSTASAAIGGGSLNRIQNTANTATIGGGGENLVFAAKQYATIPGGYRAAATNYGQFAYASGYFDEAGDAQTSVHVLRITTSGAVTNELFLDGLGERLRVRPGSTMTFDIQVAARSSGGSAGGYQFRGVIENSAAGVTAFVSTVDTVMTKEEVAAWDVQVEADNVNDALVIKGVGAAATTIRWVATVRTSEVKW